MEEICRLSMIENNDIRVKFDSVNFSYPGKVAHRVIKNRLINTSDIPIKKDVLSGISFEIKSGEVVGILGKNGSGKSTILKMISEVIFPTEGRLTVVGKKSPMIELGAGMDPEFTAEENIELFGVLIGNTLKNMKEATPEILEWSGLTQYRDYPLRKMSSGMKARLAFATATHFKPDLLIVDEVLAVGDASFQMKSSEKMNKLMTSGSTVVIVSHDVESIRNLCTRVLLVEDGSIIADGEPECVADLYESKMAK
jgi:ABC-type polysaccharide/polyol phosphate transport system ATPase subunit